MQGTPKFRVHSVKKFILAFRNLTDRQEFSNPLPQPTLSHGFRASRRSPPIISSWQMTHEDLLILWPSLLNWPSQLVGLVAGQTPGVKTSLFRNATADKGGGVSFVTGLAFGLSRLSKNNFIISPLRDLNSLAVIWCTGNLRVQLFCLPWAVRAFI